MKKFNKVLIAGLALICLSGCSVNIISKTPDDVEDKESDKTTEVTTPVFDLYSDYILQKTKLFGKFSETVFDDITAMKYAGNLLITVSSADIELVPISVLENAEKNGGVFTGNAKGCYSSDVRINSDGSFTIDYNTYSGEHESIRGSYSNATLTAEKSVGEALVCKISITAVENGYAALYTVYEGDESTLIRIAFSDEVCGMCIAESDSFDSALSIEGFLASDKLSLIYKNGELFITSSGKSVN